MRPHKDDSGYNSSSTPLQLNKVKYEESAAAYCLQGSHASINKKDRVYKKLPPFPAGYIDKYIELLEDYHQILDNYCIKTPPYQLYLKKQKLIMSQNNLKERDLGQNIIPQLSPEDCALLARMIIWQLLPIFHSNQENPHFKIGIDSNVTNWALPGFQGSSLAGDEKLVYTATTYPFIKEGKKEKCLPDFYLHHIPGIIKPVLRFLYLPEMLERYYNPREVILNLIASFIEEGRQDVTIRLLETVNPYFSSHLSRYKLKPVSFHDLIFFHKRNRYLKDMLFISRLMQKSYVEKIKGQKFDFPMPRCRVATTSMHAHLMKGRKPQQN